MKTTIPFLILSLAIVASAAAQDVEVLVPIIPDRIAGAHGSTWETELAIANTGTTPVTVFGYSLTVCPVLCNLTPPPIPPKTTIYPGIFARRCGAITGKLLTVNQQDLASLAFTLRTRDTSRDDRAWGSVIPVVRPAELRATSFSLVDVPLTPGFRTMLRVYGVDSSAAPAVLLRYFALAYVQYPVAQPDVLLYEDVPVFTLPQSDDLGSCPAYAQIPLNDPRLVAAGRIRIEMVPLDERQTYWGFVSVTNNETQEVTNIFPN